MQSGQEQTHTGVVIVGGGLAGLATAAYLAQAGHAVTLFEKAPGFGGRAATRQHDGYAFNQGVHALYTGGPASEVLAELGVHYTAGVPKATFGLRDGRLYPLPTTPLTLLTSGLLGIRDKLELLRLVGAIPKLAAGSLGHTTAEAWLDGTVHRRRVRQLLASFARTFAYSAALDLVSADVVVEKLQRTLKHPIHYVDGGWQTLVDGLHTAATKAGAQLVSRMAVEAVEHTGGQVTGVRVRGGSLVRASAVVLATTPSQAAKLVDGGQYDPLRGIVDALVPVQVACLDVALRRLPHPEHPIVGDQQRPLFLTTQSVYARLAPEGGALIHVFKQLDPRYPTDPRVDERVLEGLLDAAQPDWRDQVVRRFFLPRITAAGTLPLARSGGLAGRPSPRVPGLETLFLAGDWVGPKSSLVDTSLASARQVAQLLRTALPSAGPGTADDRSLAAVGW